MSDVGAPVPFHDDEAVPVVRETHLTRRPARYSRDVALLSAATLVLATLAHWRAAGEGGIGLAASREAVFASQEYWRLVTASLAHSDLAHLVANGVVFGLLGYLVYGYYGALAHPGLSLLLGTGLMGGVLLTYPAETRVLGASGTVYLLAGFWLALYVLLERRLRLGKRLVRALGFALVTLVPATLEAHVSHRAHALGFAVGLASGVGYFAARRRPLRSAERVVWE